MKIETQPNMLFNNNVNHQGSITWHFITLISIPETCLSDMQVHLSFSDRLQIFISVSTTPLHKQHFSLEKSKHTSWCYGLNIPDILFIWRNFRMFYRNACGHITVVLHPPVPQHHKIPAGYNTTTCFLRNLVADISMSIYYLINRSFTVYSIIGIRLLNVMDC